MSIRAAKGLGDQCIGFGAIGDTGHIGGKTRVAAKRGVSDEVGAQLHPFTVALDRDQHRRSFAGFEDAIRRDGGMGETDALWGVPAFVVEQRNGQPVGHHVEHGYGDLRALPRGAAPDECLQYRRMGRGARGDIDDRYAHPRRLRRPAGDRAKAGFGLDQQVVGLAARHRAILAEAADRAGYKPRIVLVKLLRRKAQSCQRAGLEVLDQHIGPLQQYRKRRLARFRGQIERDAFLAAVQPNEIARLAVGNRVVAAREIAFGALDLDDISAGIGQACGGKGSRHRLLDCDNLDAFQWKRRAHQNDLGRPRTCSAT